MNLYKFHDKPESLDHHDKAHRTVPKLVWAKYKDYPDELKKRESALAKDPKIAFDYASKVLKKPFPAGEAAIAKSHELAYAYAAEVLHGPFSAGEEAISKAAWWAYWYAHNVLKARFPAGEEAIAKNSGMVEMYNKAFNTNIG